MEDVNGDSPPFWPSPSAAHRRRPLLPAPVPIILFPIIALIVLFLAVPTLLSAVKHPNSVKKSWDSVNILLVSFAILCGVFARRKEDGSAPSSGGGVEDAASVAANGAVEFEAPSYGGEVAATSVGRLKRNSSSYPDLRQNLMWETGDNRFRFFDDYEISRFRSTATTSHFKLHGGGSEFGIEKTDEVKEIPVDTFVLRTPPPPPPPFVVGQKPRRTYETIARREKVEKVISQNAAPAPPPTPPPPPPSPLMRVKSQLEMRSGKSERRKSNAAKEIKMVMSSIYSGQRKRKRKQRRTENQGEIVAEIGQHFSNVPPPSPPPPPPPSMFHNLFKKGNKSRKVHPPPPAIQRTSKRNPTQSNMGRPPLPTTTTSILRNENVDNNGGHFPLTTRMSLPRPPPPFQIPETKMILKGDFVRIRSNQSSLSGSPEAELVPSTGKSNNGEGGGGGVFCPSPDVNMKADSFIARLRDGWRLEKMNSLREKTKPVFE